MLKRAATLLLGTLLLAGQARAQQVQTVTMTQGVIVDPADPNTWPQYFTGDGFLGPYAWLSPADASARGLTVANAVIGGQAAGQSLALCRSTFADGVHPGKLVGNNCNIGYAGKEEVKTTGFEVLYQTSPQHAQFLSQRWVDAASADAGNALRGGAVGITQMKVARASYQGGVHPGKEWSGKCYIGYGGQEVALNPPYEVLVLGFDKAAWQAVQTSTPTPTPTTNQVQTTPMVQTYIMQQATIPSPSSSDPNTWQATFDGVNNMGPYAWVDGPTALQSDPQLTNGVYGGQVGTVKQAVCRANFPDGMHPGKYFNGMCNIGYGGKEVVLTKDYQVLVNTQPDKAPYLKQRWNASGEGFVGGSTGGTLLRVCQTWTADGTHLGKVWQGKCDFGWGGVEKADAAYGMLFLDFDKAAWQAAQATTSGGTINGTIVLNTNLTLNQSTLTIGTGPAIDTTNYAAKMLTDFAAANPQIFWQIFRPGDLGTGLRVLADRLPNVVYGVIDQYNADQTDPAKRKDRQVMFDGVKNGNADALGIVIPLLAQRAKGIADRDRATWTQDEGSFFEFLRALAQDQKLKAVAIAQQAFEAWKVQDREKYSTGLAAMTYTPSDPPAELLAMAKGGCAITPQTAQNFGKIMTVTAGSIAATGGGLAVTLSGLGSAIFSMASQSAVAGATLSGWGLGGAGMMAGGAAAVVTLMITAGIVKGMSVFHYMDYVSQFDAAVNAAKAAVTVDSLQPFLKTGEGVTTLINWLTAQAATGNV